VHFAAQCLQSILTSINFKGVFSMGIKQVAEKAEQKVETLTLQLAGPVVRFVEAHTGALFENHKAYEFPVAEAARRLSQVDETTGTPLWKTFRPESVVKEDTSTPQAPEVVPASAALAPAAAAPAATKVVEIGTAAEAKELGLPDESDTHTV
jgi:hypothetical protein